MINKLKNNKGITLIALVITIIVLLILAGVAISMLTGDNGILKQAARAKEETEKASQNEQEDLSDLEDIIYENVNGPRKWAYKEDENGRKTIISNGKIDLPIGTYINYNAAAKDADEKEIFEYTVTSEAGSPTDIGTVYTYYKASEKTLSEGNGYDTCILKNTANTNGWRVLGVNENGEIMIISSSETSCGLRYNGIAGYIYGENELNKVCSVFGTGYGAVGARCINVDDINKITGYNPNNVGVYDPEQTGSGTKYTNYGKSITYSWTNITNQITSSLGKSSDTYFSTYGFNWYDKENKEWKNSMQDISAPDKITTATSSVYRYFAYSLTNDSSTTGIQNGISTTSNEYSTIFTDGKGNGALYVLATSFVNTKSSGIEYGLMYVGRVGNVDYNTGIYKSNGASQYYSSGIRPVVFLKSNIKLKYDKEKEYYDIVK